MYVIAFFLYAKRFPSTHILNLIRIVSSRSRSSPVIPIDSHILMTEITKPINRILATTPISTHLPPTKINLDLQVLILENSTRALLIHHLRLPTNQQPERGTAINRPETNRRPLRHDNPLAHALRVSHRAQNPAPV